MESGSYEVACQLALAAIVRNATVRPHVSLLCYKTISKLCPVIFPHICILEDSALIADQKYMIHIIVQDETGNFPWCVYGAVYIFPFAQRCMSIIFLLVQSYAISAVGAFLRNTKELL